MDAAFPALLLRSPYFLPLHGKGSLGTSPALNDRRIPPPLRCGWRVQSPPLRQRGGCFRRRRLAPSRLQERPAASREVFSGGKKEPVRLVSATAILAHWRDQREKTIRLPSSAAVWSLQGRFLRSRERSKGAEQCLPP